jgi:hypothetical protein
MSLFYFNRPKVNIVFCVLLKVFITLLISVLLGWFLANITATYKHKIKNDTVFELSGNAKVNLKDSKVAGKIKVKDNAKIVYENCEFHPTIDAEVQPLDSKLAPPPANRKEIYIKLCDEVQMRYTEFLKLKEQTARLYVEKRLLLEKLDKMDKIANYKFVEGSL